MGVDRTPGLRKKSDVAIEYDRSEASERSRHERGETVLKTIRRISRGRVIRDTADSRDGHFIGGCDGAIRVQC